MSYYDKKYIKGDPKKYDCKEDCKKHEEKEECKMEHHKYYEKEEEKGLLTEFDVDQAPSVPVSFSGVPSTGNQFAEVEVCIDDRGDRVALDATIEWQPDPLSLPGILGTILTLIATLPVGATLPLAVSATFRIWRKSSSGTVLISQKTDTSPLAGLTVLSTTGLGLLSILFGRVTTSIHAVDTDPDLGENEYFLTVNAAPVVAGSVIPGATGTTLSLIPFTGFTVTPDEIISYTFSAAEIEENE